MDEEIDRLVVSVRADTQGFGRDVATMKAALADGVGGSADRAGRTIEAALGRAVRSGKLGFDDLAQVASRVLGQIASSAITGGIGAAIGGGGGGGNGLAGLAGTLLTAALGLPGRATGGPVSPGAAYMVGERGPELFVPTASGRIEAGRGGGRDVRVALTIDGTGAREPAALARSGRQVARAVARAIEAADG